MTLDEARAWKEVEPYLGRYLAQQEAWAMEALLNAEGAQVWYVRGFVAALKNVASRCSQAVALLARRDEERLPPDHSYVPTPLLPYVPVSGEEPG